MFGSSAFRLRLDDALQDVATWRGIGQVYFDRLRAGWERRGRVARRERGAAAAGEDWRRADGTGQERTGTAGLATDVEWSGQDGAAGSDGMERVGDGSAWDGGRGGGGGGGGGG